MSALGLSLDAWVFHTQLADVIDLARAFPGTNIIMGHVGGVLGYGPYAGRRDEVFASWKASVTELAKCPNVTMKLGGMMMRAALYDYKAAERPITSEELAAAVAALHGDLHRAVRAETLHVREQFPGGEDGDRLGCAVERVQADRRRRVSR